MEIKGETEGDIIIIIFHSCRQQEHMSRQCSRDYTFVEQLPSFFFDPKACFKKNHVVWFHQQSVKVVGERTVSHTFLVLISTCFERNNNTNLNPINLGFTQAAGDSTPGCSPASTMRAV